MEILDCMLATRADINQPLNGLTPLQSASAKGSTQIVRALLASAANVDAQSRDTGETALHLASNDDVARELFAAKASPDVADHLGAKAFYRAAELGRDGVARSYFDAGILTDWEAANKVIRAVHAAPPLTALDRKLRLAAWNCGGGSAIDGYIAQGANPNVANVFGYTPLHLSASAGNVEGLCLLLRASASVDAVTLEEAFTSLHMAATNGWVEVVMQLIHAQAFIDKKSGEKHTALHLAASVGHCEVVRNLVFASASLDEHDHDGATPLHLACADGHCETVRLLLVASASVERRDEGGNMPFHLAASNGHRAVVASLLLAFAPLDQRDQDGNLTLHLAARGGHSGVVASLVEAMAPVAATNIFGNTPLHLASAYARLEVVKFLLRAQAPVNNANCRGETALHLALQDGFLEVAQTLREAGGCSPETASYDMYLPEAGWWPPKTFQVFAYPWPAPYQ